MIVAPSRENENFSDRIKDAISVSMYNFTLTVTSNNFIRYTYSHQDFAYEFIQLNWLQAFIHDGH